MEFYGMSMSPDQGRPQEFFQGGARKNKDIYTKKIPDPGGGRCAPLPPLRTPMALI